MRPPLRERSAEEVQQTAATSPSDPSRPASFGALRHSRKSRGLIVPNALQNPAISFRSVRSFRAQWLRPSSREMLCSTKFQSS
jgi:hypothetical protein